MKHYGDIKKLSGDKLPIVDVICGGSPCQDLSIAGLRNGLKGERSSLFLDQIRIIKEMRENDRQLHSKRSNVNVRPRYMVWENVVGALSSPGKDRKGEDFQKVLTEIVKVSEPDAPDVPLPEDRKWGGQGAYMTKWVNGQLLGEYMMRSFGEYPREEKESRLSQILEDYPHPKYYLSAKGCMGILMRAQRTGGKYQKELMDALKRQAGI